MTHPDADHISGLAGVLEKFPVALVALTGDQHATQIYERLLLDIRDKNQSAATACDQPEMIRDIMTHVTQ